MFWPVVLPMTKVFLHPLYNIFKLQARRLSNGFKKQFITKLFQDLIKRQTSGDVLCRFIVQRTVRPGRKCPKICQVYHLQFSWECRLSVSPEMTPRMSSHTVSASVGYTDTPTPGGVATQDTNTQYNTEHNNTIHLSLIHI